MLYNENMQKKIKKTLLNFFKKISTATFVFLLVLPSSTNYKLKDYSFGSGGSGNAISDNYSINSIVGETSAGKLSSADYKIGSGLVFTNQTNVPNAPTFNNPDNYYNKLQIIINTSGNPADTKYAIAISDDSFTTTQYVQNDNTVGAVLGVEDYQISSAWDYIIGLTSSTSYQVKVKAMQGKFTETDYGPIASAATVGPTLSFSISTNSITFSNLHAGTVVDSPQNISANLTTNGESGGSIYIYGVNGGLLSVTKSYKIDSVSGNLAALSKGFGAQGFSVTQNSGGPLTILSPYNVSDDNVGIIDSSIRKIFSSVNPIIDGSGTFVLKAKSSSITPAATDYTETLNVIASGSF
jgi:hypothetical protein